MTTTATIRIRSRFDDEFTRAKDYVRAYGGIYDMETKTWSVETDATTPDDVIRSLGAWPARYASCYLVTLDQ